jgi:hypothetical protein
MRRKRTDVIDVGMICIPDAAKLSLLVLGWLLSIAEVPWFEGGCWTFLAVFGRHVSCRATIGIDNMNCP